MNYMSDAICKLANACIRLVNVLEERFSTVAPPSMKEKMTELQEAANKIASCDIMAPVETPFKMPSEVSLVAKSEYPLTDPYEQLWNEYPPHAFTMPILCLNGVSISYIGDGEAGDALVRSLDGKKWAKVFSPLCSAITIVSIASTGKEFVVLFIADGELKFRKSSDGVIWTQSELIEGAEIHFENKEEAIVFSDLVRLNLKGTSLVCLVSQARKGGRLASGWTVTCKEGMRNA